MKNYVLMIIKHLYYFYVEGCSLRMRIKWDGSKKITSITLPCKIDSNKWDVSKQKPKNNSFHNGVSAAEITREMSRYEDIADNIFLDFEYIPTPSEFKTTFKNKINKVDSNSEDLKQVFNEFISKHSSANDLQYTSIINYRSLFKGILETGIFNKIDDLNRENFGSYHNFLVHQGYKNSSIKNKFVRLKTFIKWLNKNKNTNIVFDYDYKIRSYTNDILYLEWEELMRIYNMKFNNSLLSYYRDIFCLCSFTSLRISDAMKLRKQDIYEDYIFVITKKTSKVIKIELNDYSREIIQRYKNEDVPFGHFHSLSYFNEKLKEIGKICEINSPIRRIYYSGSNRVEKIVPKYELLSSHCGRKTFVVHCIRLGIPIEIIMRWTGHSNYDSLKHYVEIIDEVKSSSMSKFNNKITD